MRRIKNVRSSILGREVTIRVMRPLFEIIRRHLLSNPLVEQFLFTLFSIAKTADGALFTIKEIVLPDPGDLSQ